MDDSHHHNCQDGEQKTLFWRIPEGDCELLAASYSNQAFGRHAHERYAFGAIVGGVERLYYRGSYDLGSSGSLVTISPGEVHDGAPGVAGGWRSRMLYVDSAWLNQVLLQGRFASEHIHLFHQAFSADPALAQYFLDNHRLIEHAGTALERETLLIELLATLFHRHGLSPHGREVRERQAVRRIKQRLEEEFDSNLSLEELGRMVGMDPLYLIRVFKKEVGMPPHGYQLQQRVARVQRLLRAGSGLAEASFACGFCDQSHMARAFKKVVGITPRSFRDGLRADAPHHSR